MKSSEMHQRRRGVLFVGFLVCTLLLAACGSSNTGSTTPSSTTKKPGQGCNNIGISLPETNTSYRWENQDKPALNNDIKAAFPSATVQFNNAGGDPTVQQTQVASMITNGACVLVVAPHDGKQAAAIVASAKQKNIPVVSYDRLINSPDLAAYVSYDGVEVGRLQGKYIADHYEQFVNQNGTNNVVLINGAQTDNNALLFKQGLHEALDPLFQSGKLKNAYEQFTDWTSQTAQTDFEAAMTQTGNKVAVAYVANDDMASAVVSSLKIKQLDGKVLVTGQDASIPGIQNIMTGSQSMTIYKAIGKEAQATTDVVKAIINGQDVKSLARQEIKEPTSGATIPTIAETPVAVDKANIQDTILKDNFWTKDQLCKGLPGGTANIC